MNDHSDRDYDDDYGSSSEHDRDDRSIRGRHDEDRYRASSGQDRSSRGQRDFGRGQEGFGNRQGSNSSQSSGQRDYRQGGYNQGGYNQGSYGQGSSPRSSYGQGQGGFSQRSEYQGSSYGGRGQSGSRGVEDFGYPQRGYGPAGYGSSEYRGGGSENHGFGRFGQGSEDDSARWGASDAGRSFSSDERSRGGGWGQSGSGIRSGSNSYGSSLGASARFGGQTSQREGGFYGKGPKGYTRSDERIREDVSDRLSDDDEVDASEITVSVSNGEVTLEGTVSDRRSKHRAEDIADSVTGVKEVHNSLRTRKGFLQEVGDRLTGRDEKDQHGHSGSGTRNSGATASTQNTTTAGSRS